jgi:hypothetical protein
MITSKLLIVNLEGGEKVNLVLKLHKNKFIQIKKNVQSLRHPEIYNANHAKMIHLV